MAGDVNTYEQGNLIRLTGSFIDVSTGNAIDPSIVKFRVKAPDGAMTEYRYGTNAELVKDSTGNYHVDLPADQAGRYTYRFFSTGTGMAARDKVFVVTPAGV